MTTSSSGPQHGRLVLVATPIGNLGDLSPRATETLSTAHLIVCEDTRRTGKLLHHLGISGVPMVVANEHTEATASARVERELLDGHLVAVVTDAGMPGIADPGERLVKAAIAVGATVSVVPGPTAAASALVISGLPSQHHVMEGFLPRQGLDRRRRVQLVARERRTVLLYEAPHRLIRTLTDLAEACGTNRQICLARELTKLHEEVWRGTLGAALAHANDREPRGEYVLVLAGAPEEAPADQAAVELAVETALAAGRTGRDAADEVAATLGVSRRTAYDAVVNRRRPRPTSGS